MRIVVGCLALCVCLVARDGLAQRGPRIWDIALNTPATELPAAFVIRACGTNGGPPSMALKSFADFERCQAERSGLREVWFSYDDEYEYLLRAARAGEDLIGPYLANQLFGHPVIYSVLIDPAGLVRGYRVVSDSREEPTKRRHADTIGAGFKTVFGYTGWECVNLPPAEGETPFGDRFVKEVCTKTDKGRQVNLRTNFFRKPGQDFPRVREENEFDVSVRLDVISAELTGGRN